MSQLDAVIVKSDSKDGNGSDSQWYYIGLQVLSVTSSLKRTRASSSKGRAGPSKKAKLPVYVQSPKIKSEDTDEI